MTRADVLDALTREVFGEDFWRQSFDAEVDVRWLNWCGDASKGYDTLVFVTPKGRKPANETDPFYIYGSVHVEPKVAAGPAQRLADVLEDEIAGLARDMRTEYEKIHGATA